RVHVLKNTDVNRCGTGVRNRVQVYQQRMSVQVYLEMAVILGVLLLVYIRLSLRIGEVEPHLVNARAHWNVVTKLTLRLRDRHVGGDGLPHRSEEALIGDRRKKMLWTTLGSASLVVTVSFPTAPPHIHVGRSRVTGGDPNLGG